MLSYLIIDDERPNRVLLKALLGDYEKELQLLGEADGGRKAVDLIDSLQPDVIFLDIQMPDLNGFEVLQQMKHQPQVVFVTAFDQYALKAFEENTIDYLLKPVDEKRLAKTVAKLLQNKTTQASPAITPQQLQLLMRQLQPTAPRLQSMAVKLGAKIILVPVQDIAFFEAKEKYVALHTIDGKERLTDQTLTALEPQLPDYFLRVQKGTILNTHCIAEIHKHFNNRLVIKLTDKKGSEVMTGTSYINTIREKLGL
jgi:two-component system, LytTR family, response regulator